MRHIVLFCFFLTLSLANDLLTIDSLFKKQGKIRSITSLSLLGTGNANSYTIYPSLSINTDPAMWEDTKQIFLSQSFIYAFNDSFSFLISGSGSYARREYINFISNKFESKNQISFNNLWFGLSYTAPSFFDLSPQLILQSALVQRERALDTKNFYFSSHNFQINLRGYSDPALFNFFSGLTYNFPRNFQIGRVEYGHNFYAGANLSVVLSPKISLDFSAEQRLQGSQKINSFVNAPSRLLPSLNLGMTYSIDPKFSLAFFATFGAGVASPDSIFGISLWKEF